MSHLYVKDLKVGDKVNLIKGCCMIAEAYEIISEPTVETSKEGTTKIWKARAVNRLGQEVILSSGQIVKNVGMKFVKKV